jgi:hypothetical protein
VRRRRALLLAAPLALGCGGAPPSPAPLAPPPPPRPTRVVIEDPKDHDDGVELVSTRGHVEPAAVEAALQPHAAALADCYTSRLARRRWLGGHVALHWDLTAAGAIKAVQIAESDLGAWPIEKCLLDLARAVEFAPPTGGEADVAIPLDFSAKGRTEVWDEERSTLAVGAGQLAKLEQCSAELKDPSPPRPGHKKPAKAPRPTKPEVPGAAVLGPPREPVLITLYVGAHGQAESVGFASKVAFADAWADCAEKLVLGWRLPDPRGHVVKLVVPFAPR